MNPVPDKLSVSYLERHRLRLRDAYAFSPDEYFPIEVQNLFYGGTGMVYMPVLVGDLQSYRSRGESLLRAMRLIGSNSESEDERTDLLYELLKQSRDPVKLTALFFGLGYSLYEPGCEIRRGKLLTVARFFVQDLRVSLVSHQQHLFSRLPQFYGFPEIAAGVVVALEEKKDLEDSMVWPLVRAQAIILREAAFFVIGGEVVRAGMWLIEWGRGLAAIQATVRFALSLAAKYPIIAEGLVFIARALGVILNLGLRLLDLLGMNDVLLEIMPVLVEFEDKLKACVEAEIAIRSHGAMALDGWMVDPDDPTDQEYVFELMSQESEG